MVSQITANCSNNVVDYATSDNVRIWTDGGPKHFKNSHALFAIAQLAKKHKVCEHK